MKFFIEQIAICPSNPRAAKELLEAIGAESWAEDTVVAEGTVYREPAGNIANLSFNYDLGPVDSKLEFEVLHYTDGVAWTQDEDRVNSVSHLGMHCTAAELVLWRGFFAKRGIKVAQEVLTAVHTNPAIKDSRRYHYVIFDTKDILGVDLKFIVRRDISFAS
jgi:hypothetical protein